MNETISKKEYMSRYAGREVFKSLNSAAILGYVCMGISVAVYIFAAVSVSETLLIYLIEPAVMLVLLLLAHIKKISACAIVYTIIAAIDVIVGLATSGKFVGILPLIAGINMIRAFGGINKSYHLFLREREYSLERENTMSDSEIKK